MERNEFNQKGELEHSELCEVSSEERNRAEPVDDALVVDIADCLYRT